MKQRDWIPSKESDRIAFFENWGRVVTSGQALQTTGWDASECAALTRTMYEARDAYNEYRAEPTQANCHLKDDAIKAAEEAIRKFANEKARFNPKVTHDILVQRGIPPADSDAHHTPAPVPKDGPEPYLEIDAAAPGVVRAHYKGAKPEGCKHCEISWCVSSDTPEKVGDMKDAHQDVFSRSPWEKKFDALPAGSHFHCALRWVLSGNRASPWSVVKSSVVS
jgi:hypothetical protein